MSDLDGIGVQVPLDQGLTPSGSHRIPVDPCEHLHNKLQFRGVVAAGSAAVLVVVACWGLMERGVARAQDAGSAGSSRAEEVHQEVAALRVVVAEDRQRSDAFAAAVQSDIRALSLQMVTGRQPEQLRLLPDGGSP